MDFTREPVVETILSPREGYKLAVRSSNRISQEEFFVDSLEIVSFGNSFFYRSLERPKNFLVPVNHYEVIEVRETRVVLKHATVEAKTIKIGVGKDNKMSQPARKENRQPAPSQETQRSDPKDPHAPMKVDKKRDRRRTRRRKGKEDGDERMTEDREAPKVTEIPVPSDVPHKSPPKLLKPASDAPPLIATLLPPPRQLISETISRYKEFVIPPPPLEPPTPKDIEKTLHEAVGQLREHTEPTPPPIPSHYQARDDEGDEDIISVESDASIKRNAPGRMRRKYKKDEEETSSEPSTEI